jgi:hypothetical protein
MKKIADASLLGDRIFLNSRKGTRSVAALSEPIFELDISDSLEKIGCKIRECIDSFQPGNERYDSEKWKTVYDPLINLADEKNPKTFFPRSRMSRFYIWMIKLLFSRVIIMDGRRVLRKLSIQIFN